MNSDQIWDAIQQVGAEPSKLKKEELLRGFLQDDQFRRVIELVYDPFITFGVTSRVMDGRQNVETASAQPFGDMTFQILDALAKRELTGLEAAQVIAQNFNGLTEKSRKLFLAIIDKTLRAGFTESTINKARPGTIRTFSVMLSHPFEAHRVKSWPVAGEPKIDGMRVLIMVKDGQVEFLSRTGKPYESLGHFDEPVRRMIEDCANAAGVLEWKIWFGDDQAVRPAIVLDGEVTAGANFNETGAVRRQEAATDAVLTLFDVVPYHLFVAQEKIDIPFQRRRAFLERMVFNHRSAPNILTSEQTKLFNEEEVHAYFAEQRAKGREGAMIKLLNAPYVKRKGHLWMKMKAQETEDLRVIDWFNGDPGTKYEKVLGGLIVDRNGVDVRVGGGYSDEQRTGFERMIAADLTEITAIGSSGAGEYNARTDKPLRIFGRLIEVEFHEVTPDGSLRHPRFVRFRDDKDERLGRVA